MWKDLPPDIATVLRNVKRPAVMRYINMYQTSDGYWKMTLMDATMTKIEREVRSKDPVQALLQLLGPAPGGSWAAHLLSAKQSEQIAEEEEDDDDDFDVV